LSDLNPFSKDPEKEAKECRGKCINEKCTKVEGGAEREYRCKVSWRDCF